MIGADNGGIDWRGRQKTRPHMPGQMISVSGFGVSLVCRCNIGASVCIPSRPSLCVNDLGSEPPGL